MSYEVEGVRHIGARQPLEQMSQRAFTTKVLPIFGAALAMTAAGTYLGATYLPREAFLPIMFAELALVFTSGLWRRVEGLNQLLFFVYAVMSGMTLVPILAWTAHIGGVSMIIQALAVSTVTFAGCAAYGLTTKKDMSGLGTFLMASCIGLIVALLLNTLIFHSGVMSLVASVAGIALFAGFTAYDMNQIRRSYAEADYVLAALALYIDFIGLFTYVLRFMGLWGGRDD